MKRLKIALGILFVLFAISAVVYNQNKKTDSSKTLTVSVVMPMSGGLANFGENVLRGVEIAFEQSGISTDDVKIISEDTDGFNSGGALSAWRRSVELDKADIVFGPFGPAQTLTVAPTFSKSDKNILVVSISNCDDRFSEYQNILCIYPGIREQVDSAINFMDKKEWRNVYLLTENSEFGLLVESVLKENSKINLIGSEKVATNNVKDFRGSIVKALSKKPDVVFSVFSPNEGMILLRQYPVLARQVPLLISTDIQSGQLEDIFGGDADNIFFAARLSENYDTDFSKLFEEKYNASPDYFAALSHSAASLVFDALRTQNNPDNLNSRIIQKTSQTAAIKDFSFDSNRRVSIPLSTYIFKDKKFIEADF